MWRQHQAYVREHISAQEKLRASLEKNRDLAFFFGAGPAKGFWNELSTLEIGWEGNWAIIDLAAQKNAPTVVSSLVRGLRL